MSNKKELRLPVGLKLTETEHELARKYSKKAMGKENVSGYYPFLLHEMDKRDKEINNT